MSEAVLVETQEFVALIDGLVIDLRPSTRSVVVEHSVPCTLGTE